MKTIILTLLLIPGLCFGQVVDPLNISEDDAKLDAQIQKSCDKYFNVAQGMACQKHLREQYTHDGKFRGTEEYCSHHYKHLSNDALYQNLGESLKLKKTARYRLDILNDPVKGEITKEDYDAEIAWLAKELKDRHYTPRALVQ